MIRETTVAANSRSLCVLFFLPGVLVPWSSRSSQFNCPLLRKSSLTTLPAQCPFQSLSCPVLFPHGTYLGRCGFPCSQTVACVTESARPMRPRPCCPCHSGTQIWHRTAHRWLLGEGSNHVCGTLCLAGLRAHSPVERPVLTP